MNNKIEIVSISGTVYIKPEILYTLDKKKLVSFLLEHIVEELGQMTDYLTVISEGETGDLVMDDLKKGDKISIEGELESTQNIENMKRFVFMKMNSYQKIKE